MNLHQYYKENKDEINSSIMEIASDLAIARLVDKHKLPFDAYVEPEDPDDPDSGTCYKEEYQDEYNRFYDEEYNRLAQLMKFDITSPDGIARNGNESRVTEVKTVYATVTARLNFLIICSGLSRIETVARCPRRISTTSSTSSAETRKPWATSL